MKHSSGVDNGLGSESEIRREGSALPAFTSLTPVRLFRGAGGDSAGIALEASDTPIPLPTLSEHPESLHKLPVEELRNYLSSVITACLTGEDMGPHLSFIMREEKIIQGIGRKTERAIQEEIREAAVAGARIKALRSWISEEIVRVRDGEESDFDPVEAKAAHERLLGEKRQYNSCVWGLDKMYDENTARMAEITRALGRITRHIGAEIEFDGLTGNMFNVC